MIGGDARDGDTILQLRRDAGANFERHRHSDSGRNRREYACHEKFVGEQRRSGVSIAYLLRRAAHVDIDDLSAVIHIESCGVRHLGRIRANNLYRTRLSLSCVVAASATLRCITQAPVAGDHFGNGQACAKLPA